MNNKSNMHSGKIHIDNQIELVNLKTGSNADLFDDHDDKHDPYGKGNSPGE